MLNRMSKKSPIWAIIPIMLLTFWGCAHHQKLPEETNQLVYSSNPSKGPKTDPWAPAFVVYGHSKNYNQIGRPTATQDPNTKEKFHIDTDDPVVYVMERQFQTTKAAYTNRIYRIHFPKTPYSLIPFNLTAGKNIGLIVVVTLNTDNLPVLVTTVHTCGCYKALVPTEYLPQDALPKNWTGKRKKVYGEYLPPRLAYKSTPSPQMMVHLRPGVHRVMDLDVQPSQILSSPKYQLIQMKTAPMNQLRTLPTSNGSTSFYHTKGILKGHVKGSVKPLETLFMSLISLDLFVGTDKDYADPAETGNRFYTSLKPWRRDDSNMWDFAKFLAYWGWRL